MSAQLERRQSKRRGRHDPSSIYSTHALDPAQMEPAIVLTVGLQL